MKTRETLSKKVWLTAQAILLVSMALIAQPSAPDGYKWEKVNSLSDEFNGSFDLSKWYHSTWDYDLETSVTSMNSSQVTVSNGTLKIKAELNGYSPEQINHTVKHPGIRWMKSGRIMSKDKITYPMYSESRIKASSISAYNTYWFNDGNSQQRDEIDVIENNAAPTLATEFGTDNQPYYMLSSLWTADGGISRNEGKHFDTRTLPDGFPGKGKKVDEEYFTYGVYWVSESLCKFYINGKEVMQSTPPVRPFTANRELYMLFGMWSNWWDGYPNPYDLQNNNKNTMYVDFVRTYKLTTDPDYVEEPEDENEDSANGNTTVTMKKRNSVSFSIDGGNDGTNGQNVYLWSFNEYNINQQWIQIDRGNGYYSYKKKNTDFCLDGGNGGANGQNVYLWTCNDNNQNQHWKKVDVGSGKVRLEKRNAPEYSIDGGNGGANGQNLYLWASNNYNYNQHWIMTTLKSAQISMETESSFSIFPNPANDILNMNGLGNDSYQYSIYDITGIIRKSDMLNSEITSINISDLCSGTYTLKILNKTDNRIVFSNFIKQ